jgi:hypothetical protein
MADEGLPKVAQKELLSALERTCSEGAFSKVCPFLNDDVPRYLSEVLDPFEAVSDEVDPYPIVIGYAA